MATPTTTTGWILRVGSHAGIAGALLGLVGNLLHPATLSGTPKASPARSSTAGCGSPITWPSSSA
jgi:hypothetical protein